MLRIQTMRMAAVHRSSSKPHQINDMSGNGNNWGSNLYPSYPPSHSPRASIDPMNQDSDHGYAAGAGTGYTPVVDQGPSYNSEPAVDSGPMWSASNEKPRSGGNKKWYILGGVLVLVAVIVGVAVGVATHKKSSSSSSSSGSSSSSSGGGGSGGGSGGTGSTAGWTMSANNVVQYNPKDLSQFTKDPRLHPSFYGVAYSPAGSILPTCGATFAQVLEDVYLLSQLTTRVRLYGTDCNATELVIDAIQRTKTNLSVYVGIYIDSDDSVYQRQRNETEYIIQTYGTDQIIGFTVGNEFILDNLTALGSQDPTSSAGIAAAEFLVAKITDFRAMLASLSLKKTIPVGNGDAGSYTNVQLLSAVDYFMGNIHPWFGNVAVDQAAGWTWQFWQTNNVALAAQTPNHPQTIIAEVGWPSGSNDTASDSDGPSLANIPTLQTFIDDWVCPSNSNGTEYFWFEFFDEEWKAVTYGGVEGFWGIFDSTKQLKNVTIPTCTSN
ncbi:hypothetical protein FRB96_004912 [Tulasnella sp. 330]|nr:hypothetical protein FRB96_004912 [Tulasnella sp. 330]KAG8880479.1 hypothetical protein FRB98_005064 [Tulasnella sp. 332]